METRSKKEIRSEVKKHRREATQEQIRANSNAICEKFLELQEYKETSVVFAYMDCKNEVETKAVIEQCWKDKKNDCSTKGIWRNHEILCHNFL